MGVNEMVAIAVFIDEDTVKVGGIAFELGNDVAHILLDGILERLFQVEEPVLIGDGVPTVIAVGPFVTEHFIVVMMPPLESADLMVADEAYTPVVCGDTGEMLKGLVVKGII